MSLDRVPEFHGQTQHKKTFIYLPFNGKYFVKQIEMVEKMHKAKINFSSLDLRFLQFV